MNIPSIRTSIAMIGIGVGMIILALIVPEPPPNDPQGLAACQLLHPEKYCRLTYAPSTLQMP